MTTLASAPVPADAAENRRNITRYGYFTADGREYCITDPRTPRPWANLISNPRVGLAVSQTGSGFSWIDNSQLAVITRWEQDLARDSSGKFLFVRDRDSGALWSLSPAPTWAHAEHFLCRHGLGYTTFETTAAGIAATWTLFVHPHDAIEYWRVELHNTGAKPRRLDLSAFLEWNCGVAPSPRREFHKLFIETHFDPARRAVLAWNHMWEVSSQRWGHWNTSFPYVAALACTEPIAAALGDKASFLGRYGSLSAPEALRRDAWTPRFGRHEDPVAALRSPIELRPDERRVVGYALVIGESRGEVERTVQDACTVACVDRALRDAVDAWRHRLAPHRIATPDASIDALANDWLRYQAISGRIWGRAGYYQQSGAFGFRDQLQDAQVWLTMDPAQTRAQLNLHAAHQFADGSVFHWWHPLTEQGHVTRMTDDLLWLAFVASNYVRETGDLTVLADATPFRADAAPSDIAAGGSPAPADRTTKTGAAYPLVEHVWRAFERVFQRSSARGLPLIGAGDWNDGLSAVGLQERGESIWLAHFLAGLLADWADVFRRLDSAGGAIAGPADMRLPRRDRWSALAADFAGRRARLVAAINEHAWDGAWYQRATFDDGSILGTHKSRVARIFLNAQTWAILNDTAPPERARACWDAVRTHLIADCGALLLAPAFDTPVREVGYITRYAPGLRENGGVYTHAATWAIAAAAKMRDADAVGTLLRAINPAIKDPERYWAEPYVLPGNVDGPDSPYCGRAGWTWYTGSAQWLHRVICEWVLGVRPGFDTLRIDPVLPPGWNEARMTRRWRGSEYVISIVRDAQRATAQAPQVVLDGQALTRNEITPDLRAGERHEVVVHCA
ncbi:MAG: glycosyl transferase family 36 [Phycisphaerae bacterium]